MSSFSLISEKFIKETIVSFILFPKHSGVKCSAYMPITWWVLWTSFCFFSEPNGSHRQLNFWFLSKSVKENSDFQTFVNDTSEVLSWIRTNDTDWEIYVNGQPSTSVKLADALLGVKLPADTEICKIELRYVPHTFYIGLAVSGSALLFFLFWYMIFRKKQIQN